MLHRLLACLALLTGLTLIGTPAYARDGSSVSAQVEQRDSSSVARSAVRCLCRKGASLDRLPRSYDAVCYAALPLRVYLPAVEFGSDRALE